MSGAGRRRDDAGAAELFVLILIPIFLVAVGLVWDLGGYMRAQDQAAWCAQQAARAATGRLDAEQLQGGTAVVAGPQAVATAGQVAAVAGMTGSAVVNADGSVTASCTGAYQPIILSVPGKQTWHTTEHGTARPAYGITGEKRP